MNESNMVRLLMERDCVECATLPLRMTYWSIPLYRTIHSKMQDDLFHALITQWWHTFLAFYTLAYDPLMYTVVDWRAAIVKPSMQSLPIFDKRSPQNWCGNKVFCMGTRVDSTERNFGITVYHSEQQYQKNPWAPIFIDGYLNELGSYDASIDSIQN